jgi:hypothetical protein
LVFYEGFLIGGVLLASAIPLVIYRFRKPEWAGGGADGDKDVLEVEVEIVHIEE